MAKDSKDQKETKLPDADAQNPGATETVAPAAPEKAADQSAGVGKAIEKQKIQVLYVVAKREGFRRAGYVFGGERTRLPVDELTHTQIKQLKEEPMLVVTEITEEV